MLDRRYPNLRKVEDGPLLKWLAPDDVSFWTAFAKKIEPLTGLKTLFNEFTKTLDLYLGTAGSESFTLVYGVPCFQGDGRKYRPNADQIAQLVNLRKMEPEMKDHLIARNEKARKDHAKDVSQKGLDNLRPEIKSIADKVTTNRVTAGYDPALSGAST